MADGRASITPDLRKLKKMAFEAILATPVSLAW